MKKCTFTPRASDHMGKTLTLSGLFRISRPYNLVIVGFAQFMTALCLVESSRQGLPVVQDPNLYLLIFSTLLLMAAGYVINDYYDVKIDYINKPREVIIGKGMKRRVALLLHTTLNLAGIGIAAMISPRIAVMHFIASFLLWLYSNSLKRLPLWGNLVVALLTGGSIWIVGYYYQKAELIVLTYALFAFFLNLIHAIIKDIEDRQGDRKHGVRSIPIVFGFRNTKRALFLIAFIFIAVIIIVTIKINNPLLFYYFGGLGIFFLYYLYKIYRADRKAHFSQLSLWSKILMLVGILSMLFL